MTFEEQFPELKDKLLPSEHMSKYFCCPECYAPIKYSGWGASYECTKCRWNVECHILVTYFIDDVNVQQHCLSKQKVKLVIDAVTLDIPHLKNCRELLLKELGL